MGRSWVLAARLTVPARAVKRFLAASVNPAAFAPWPALLESPALLEGKGETTVGQLLAELEGESFTRVTRAGGSLALEALLSDDGWLWADRRAHLAALGHVAANHGGEGGLLVGPAGDNTSAALVGVAAAAGAARFTSPKGAARKDAVARLAEVERAIWERHEAASLARARAEPLLRNPRVQAVHTEILARLAALPADHLLAAAARDKTRFWSKPDGRDLGLARLFPTAPVLLRGLGRVDERLDSWAGPSLAGAALSLLAIASPEQGRELAAQVVAACSRGTKNGTAGILGVAQGLVVTKADPSALKALRAAMPSAAPYGTKMAIRQLPIVKKLAGSKAKPLQAAVRKELARVLGGPLAGAATWKTLSSKDACYASALLHILTAQKAADADLLRAVKSHPDPLCLLG